MPVISLTNPDTGETIYVEDSLLPKNSNDNGEIEIDWEDVKKAEVVPENSGPLQVDVYARPERPKPKMGKFKDQKELRGWSGDMTAFYSSALDWGSLGISDMAAKYISPEELETWEAARKANPVYSGVGAVVGVAANAAATKGVGLLGVGGRVAAKTAAARLGANETVAKAAGWTGEKLAKGAGWSALYDTHEMLDQIEKTEDWNKARDAWSDFGKQTIYNGAVDAVLGDMLVPFAKYIMSPTHRAKSIVGRKALRTGRRAFDEAIAKGESEETAKKIARLATFKEMPEQTVAKIVAMEKKDENFAKAMTDIFVAKGVLNDVINTQAALTGAQTAEYSKNLNKALYGSGYKNQMGSTSPDFSLEGLLYSMGIRMEKGKPLLTERAIQVREEALKGAQKHVNDAIRMNGVWEGRTLMQKLGGELKSLLRNDYDAFLEKLTQNRKNLAYRRTPEATMAAEERMKQEISDIAIEMAEKGGNKLPPEAYEQAAAKKYIQNLIEYGTDDVYTIGALENTLDVAFPKAVEEGLAGPLGEYAKRVNTMILDDAAIVGENARGLYWTNQSYRWANKVKETYNKAYEFRANGVKATREQEIAELRALDDYLNQGLDAEDTIIRKSIFKGAMANRFLQAAKEGNRDEAARIKSWISKNGDLVGKAKVFRPDEFDMYYEYMQPELEAARKINAIVNIATDKSMAYAGNAAEAVAKGIGAVMTSGITSNAVRISVQSFWSMIKFGGPETAKRMATYLENPSWYNFNALIDSAKDTTTKFFMNKMIQNAVKEAAEAEAMSPIDAGIIMQGVDLRS